MCRKGLLGFAMILASMTAIAEFDSSRTAVVVVEFQNQWTEPGLYNRMIKEQYESRDVYQNTTKLLEVARANDYRVIHAPLIIDPKNKKGWFAWLTFGRFFTKDTDRSDFTPGIMTPGDMIVTGRYAFDGFVGSTLEQTLREEGVDTLLFCGFTTEHCVDMTMETAVRNHGLDAWLIPECTATKNASLQSETELKWSERNRLLPLSKAVDLLTGKSEHLGYQEPSNIGYCQQEREWLITSTLSRLP